MKTKIFIADDHKLVLDGLSFIVKSHSEFELVGTGENGKEALRFLENLKIDILMTDLDMPEMNGQELTKEVKKLYPQVKVLVLTMHDEKGVIKNLMNLGADGYILKNSDQNEMIRALETIRSGKKYFSSDVAMALNSEKEDSQSKSELIHDFTERELEIIKLLANGLSNKEIGTELFISHRTVDTHRTNIMKKLDVHNIAGLIRFALKNGLAD